MQQREIIRPQFNEPLTFKLDFGAEGILRKGPKGTQYQYIFNDDSCIMWLEPAGRDALLRANAQAGDSVRLVKKRHQGEIVFTAEVLGDAAELADDEEASDLPSWDQLQQQQQLRRIQQQQPARVAAAPAPAPRGRQIAAAQPVPQQPAVHPMEDIALRLFEASARIIKASEEYCKAHGLPVESNFEDVRALAIHFLISRERRGQ